MSTYLYKCVECGNEQEEKHPMKETPDVKCKQCGRSTQKLLSAEYTGVSAYFFEGAVHTEVKFRPRS